MNGNNPVAYSDPTGFSSQFEIFLHRFLQGLMIPLTGRPKKVEVSFNVDDNGVFHPDRFRPGAAAKGYMPFPADYDRLTDMTAGDNDIQDNAAAGRLTVGSGTPFAGEPDMATFQGDVLVNNTEYHYAFIASYQGTANFPMYVTVSTYYPTRTLR